MLLEETSTKRCSPHELCEVPSPPTVGEVFSVIRETDARACGFIPEATLCKKHHDEQVNRNKSICCFPLNDDNDCCGGLVSCPRRLFNVFDHLNDKASHIGTFICEKHLLLVDKDERIYKTEGYILPKKRSRSESPSLPDLGELIKKVEHLEKQNKLLEQREREAEEKNSKHLKKIEEITQQNDLLTKKQEQQDELRKENTMLQRKLTGDTTFSTLVQQFHKAFTKHSTNGGKNLYDPNEMESFCEVHAPGLFTDVYTAIYNDDKRKPSKKRESLQRSRVVALLHSLSFFETRKELADKNKQDIGKIIKTAIQEKSFIMLVEDDIHFIHASRQPTSSKTSTAWHMCTGIMDVQQSVSALPRPPTVQDLHRIVPVIGKNGAVKQCRGELMVYSDEARHELELLERTWLIDEFEQSLKSVQNYKSTLEHLLREAPDLVQYLQLYAAVLTGDYPTWKYNKKLLQRLWDAEADPASPIPSLIPWQGPFHVSLNAAESTVLLFRPFFELFYKAIFGRNKVLPKRPKSHKIVTIITAAFGGWTIIRHEVLRLFGTVCKDPEYMLLHNLFEEILPLIFYLYHTVFRGGDLQQWLDVLFRMSLLFITFRRRNYDKATLCQLSDMVYHMRENRALTAIMEQHLCILTEKKVEIFHSVLRSHTISQHLTLHLTNAVSLLVMHLGQEPDPLLACDNVTCVANTDFEQEIVRLNCGHTFHRGCITKGGEEHGQDHSYALTHEVKCPICYNLLQQRMEELAQTFNR
ncbi:hypothetical protein OS493_032400 [Desmophyllum pertusum]|uniref:RING-type domain-containing protein n=1 Tax=Desmophyllum pertusum TaxID=174260 RepID=A0A9X0CCL7_9CNID|nr:hypothetical protein OS493_032400 [Desmophyllum pertusum]